MLAFAANSILCRLALGGQLIDAASFTTIRLCSGAITLALIVVLRESSISSRAIDIPSALALFCYALCFSFAYIDLAAGTGALILFGSVQLTMIMYGLLNGDSPSRRAWLGIVVAFCGLVYLVSPGATAPSLNSATLMAVAGIAWGIYSLRGRRTDSPILSTAWNFIATAPRTLAASLLFIGSMEMTPAGVGFAILSGAVASSLGYIIWYTAIPYLTPTTAATVQLCVPVIAATGGVLFVTEPLSVRLTVSGVLILGGIALVIKTKGSLDK
jgi:drug/metabolite transporter (DMT)-like permease